MNSILLGQSGEQDEVLGSTRVSVFLYVCAVGELSPSNMPAQVVSREYKYAYAGL